jgi:hypothetical protein
MGLGWKMDARKGTATKETLEFNGREKIEDFRLSRRGKPKK